MSVVAVLPDHCLSVAGCTRPRLRYAGYCDVHSPTPVPPRVSGRCNAPIRCYCPSCVPPRGVLGPHHSAETIRMQLEAAARRRAAQDTAPVVLEVVR